MKVFSKSGSNLLKFCIFIIIQNNIICIIINNLNIFLLVNISFLYSIVFNRCKIKSGILILERIFQYNEFLMLELGQLANQTSRQKEPSFSISALTLTYEKINMSPLQMLKHALSQKNNNKHLVMVNLCEESKTISGITTQKSNVFMI